MQIVSNGDNLHELSNPVTVKNKKCISKCSLLNILPRVLMLRMQFQQATFKILFLFYPENRLWHRRLSPKEPVFGGKK